MARRQKQSPFEDLVDIAARLPWWLSLVLALVSYLALHHWAMRTEAPPTNLTALGAFEGRQLYRVLAMGFQYIVPFAFVLGAIVSAIQQHHRSRRFDQTRSIGTRGALLDMNWQQFEGLVGEYFRRQGYAVSMIGGNGPDGGVDVELRRGSELFLVQCKQWRATKVGVSVVRELYGAMAARGAAGGYVVTSGEFTAEARAFCEGRNIQLLDGDGLNEAIRTSGRSAPAATVAPPVAAPTSPPEVAPSCPKCQAPMTRRVAKQGPKAGESFWGCSRYPQCYGLRPN